MTYPESPFNGGQGPISPSPLAGWWADTFRRDRIRSTLPSWERGPEGATDENRHPPPSWGVAPGLALVILFALCRTAHAHDIPLRVDARVPKGTYHVGQGVEVRVGVVAEGERPKLTAPKIDGADLAAIDTAFRQAGASGIGDLVTETNVFVTRYRVTPSRPGPLTIPPFVARLGDRRGASTPIRLTIHAVPPEGRPASYLRGVGPIEARAEAVPASVRVGQAFEYRLALNGPGARGSTQWPILPEFERIKGLRIEPAGSEAVADPPSRTFRYRARATEPAALILPAVAVATYDPAMKRYVETRAPSVAVRVVDVPRFDPSTLPAIPDDRPSETGPSPWVWAVPAVAVAAAWLMVARVRMQTSARRWARRAARGFATTSSDEVAARVASGMKGYLARALDHRGGELTPDEAAREVARAVDDPNLAERARRLIEASDGVRFGHEADSTSALAAEASAFFEELSRRRPRNRPS